MRIRLNQQIRSYNDYANFRVWGRHHYTPPTYEKSIEPGLGVFIFLHLLAFYPLFREYILLLNILFLPFCPYHFVHAILSNTILSVYHFVHTILSVAFFPLPFCPKTMMQYNIIFK